MSDEKKEQLSRYFEEARTGATPIRVYGEKEINTVAAKQAAARAKCSVDEVVDAVKHRHRDF